MNRRIVMIDAYVDIHHSIFRKSNIKNLELINNKWIETTKMDGINPHGTAIAGILVKAVPENIEIINFDIYDQNNDKQLYNLLKALEYIYNNLECDVLNMSLGIRTHDENLFNLCKKIYNKGILIVAAFDNAGAISYPAAYDFVIGVDVSPKIKKRTEYVWVGEGQVNIRGMGGLQRVAWANGFYTINQGSSFAAPHITGIIMQYILKDAQNVLKKMKENAIFSYDRKDDLIEERELNFNIKKAALFPFNKEMHALVNYPELLSFEIVKIYDCKYTNHLGKKVGKDSQYIIEDITNCQWDGFDTMIIGHLSELEALMGREIKFKILDQCLENKINVFLYDDYGITDNLLRKFHNKKIDIIVQKTQYGRVHNKFGKLYSIKAPVLGVFGTSKRQGKYTLQLLLRKKFLEKGYKLGQLGTEPNSLLFGMDEVYAIGYNGISNRSSYEIIEDVNCLMHKIDLKNPDLIILGSQSGTTPMAFNNISQIPLMQCSFLVGGLPDATILNVNFEDSINYIKRTVKLIEGLGRGKVISIVIYPCAYQNGWGIIRDVKSQIDDEDILESRRSEIEKNLNIKTYILGNEKHEKLLLDTCIDFFSGGRR